MLDTTSFEQALLENPSDNSLRMVYADWLEEQGDPRGELLRITTTLTQNTKCFGHCEACQGTGYIEEGYPQGTHCSKCEGRGQYDKRPELEARLFELVEEGVPAIGPFKTNSLGMTFAWVSAGRYMMGSPEDEPDRYEDEKLHYVEIKEGYWVMITQVTQAQWEAVMGSNPSYFKGADLPVENVSWNDCQMFLKKLNAMEGSNWSLLTEEKWEYACRAGSSAPYYFGRDASKLKDYAWFYNNSDNKTHPVGEKKPNAFGLYDMLGNVWEWCQDKYKEYPECSDPTEVPPIKAIPKDAPLIEHYVPSGIATTLVSGSEGENSLYPPVEVGHMEKSTTSDQAVETIVAIEHILGQGFALGLNTDPTVAEAVPLDGSTTVSVIEEVGFSDAVGIVASASEDEHSLYPPVEDVLKPPQNASLEALIEQVKYPITGITKTDSVSEDEQCDPFHVSKDTLTETLNVVILPSTPTTQDTLVIQESVSDHESSDPIVEEELIQQVDTTIDVGCASGIQKTTDTIVLAAVSEGEHSLYPSVASVSKQNGELGQQQDFQEEQTGIIQQEDYDSDHESSDPTPSEDVIETQTTQELNSDVGVPIKAVPMDSDSEGDNSSDPTVLEASLLEMNQKDSNELLVDGLIGASALQVIQDSVSEGEHSLPLSEEIASVLTLEQQIGAKDIPLGGVDSGLEDEYSHPLSEVDVIVPGQCVSPLESAAVTVPNVVSASDHDSSDPTSKEVVDTITEKGSLVKVICTTPLEEQVSVSASEDKQGSDPMLKAALQTVLNTFTELPSAVGMKPIVATAEADSVSDHESSDPIFVEAVVGTITKESDRN